MMIVVIIFLNALMVIPVTLNYAEMESFPLEEYYPIAASQLVDDQVLDEIQTVVVNEVNYLSRNHFRLKMHTVK